MKILRMVGATGFTRAVLMYLAFRRQKDAAIRALSEGSHILDTVCGPVEVAVGGVDVELFVNGVGAGLQIVPTYRFEIGGLLHPGINQIAIEVASTLERERAAGKRGLVERVLERLQERKIKDPTGITGNVRLYVPEK